MIPLMKSNSAYANIRFADQVKSDRINDMLTVTFAAQAVVFHNLLKDIDREVESIVHHAYDVRSRIRDATRKLIAEYEELSLPELRCGSISVLCDGSNQFLTDQVNVTLRVQLTPLRIFSLSRGLPLRRCDSATDTL